MGDIADYYIGKMTGDLPKHIRKELNQMAYEPKPGDISLFKNAKTSEKSPDFSGSLIAHRDIRAGEKIGVSMWHGKSGSKVALSGKVQDLYVKDPKKAALDKAVDYAIEEDRKRRLPVEEPDCPF